MGWSGIVAKSFTSNTFETYVSTIMFTSWKPVRVVLHNTSSPKLSEWAKCPGEQRMKNLEHYYRDTMKWSAGPHLFIADDFIWVFTPLNMRGVHSPSWNSDSWGVEMVGDYENEDFNSSVRLNTISALATLHAKLGLDPTTLKLHREDPKTTHKLCPGKNVSKVDIVFGVKILMDWRKPTVQEQRFDVISPVTTFSGGW